MEDKTISSLTVLVEFARYGSILRAAEEVGLSRQAARRRLLRLAKTLNNNLGYSQDILLLQEFCRFLLQVPG